MPIIVEEIEHCQESQDDSPMESDGMSEIWPKTTSDERDPKDEQEEETRRHEEIESDKPPHHE